MDKKCHLKLSEVIKLLKEGHMLESYSCDGHTKFAIYRYNNEYNIIEFQKEGSETWKSSSMNSGVEQSALWGIEDILFPWTESFV
jgi:hypothetical protein